MTSAQAREATVDRVMAAAAKVFGEQGYHGATIPLIASAAGMSVGTVASVGSKDDLFLRSVGELSTANSLAMIREASTAPTVTERVWGHVGPDGRGLHRDARPLVAVHGGIVPQGAHAPMDSGPWPSVPPPHPMPAGRCHNVSRVGVPARNACQSQKSERTRVSDLRCRTTA